MSALGGIGLARIENEYNLNRVDSNMTKHKRNRIKYRRIRRLVWRVLTLIVAVTALVIALQNRVRIEWMQSEQDLMIELNVFPDAMSGENK